MAALRARRLVWSAMSLMTPMISPICSPFLPRSPTALADWLTSAAIPFISSTVRRTTSEPSLAEEPALVAALAASALLRATSVTEADISWTAEATCSVWRSWCSSPRDICSLLAAIWVEAPATSRVAPATSLMTLWRLSRNLLNHPESCPISSPRLRLRRLVRSPSPVAMSWNMATTVLMGRMSRARRRKAKSPSATATVGTVQAMPAVKNEAISACMGWRGMETSKAPWVSPGFQPSMVKPSTSLPSKLPLSSRAS